jgi:DNA-binding transcriptional MerR regulator
MDYRFKIGEVAGIFDISIRALRLYDKLGVLKPGFVDEATGYRYYTTEQVQQLQSIISLRGVGFSLIEIKAVLDDERYPERLLGLLSKKKGEWVDRIETAKFKVKLISEMENNALAEAERTKDRTVDPEKRAYRLSRLVTLENSKVDSQLSEVLWL